MKKKLLYNEYGAPIQNNPKWCDLISWILRKISSLFYPGLTSIPGKRYSIYMWFQSEAYAWADLQCFTNIKGYKK